jgi:hypothetical protein
MHGSSILLSSPPKGVRKGGIAGVAMYPGTVVQVKLGVALSGGLHTFIPYTPGADGDPSTIAVVLDDPGQGMIPTTQLPSGQVIVVYFPLPGEELNVLCAGEAGTGSANVFTVGTRFIVQNSTGKLIVEATPTVSAPFTCLEKTTEVPDVDTLVYVMRN